MIIMNREHIKTFILTILVIMSIIFTQKIWLYSPVNLLKSNSNLQETSLEEIKEIKKQVIMPRSIVVSFGNSYYTKLQQDMEEVWEESKNILSNYFIADVKIISSTDEKYQENIRLKSIELEFGKNISSVLVSSIFDTVDNKIVNNIKDIKKILITTSNKGIIYITEKNNNVYEIKLEKPEGYKQALNLVNNIQARDYIKYYPLFADVGNYTIMPINYDRTIEKTFVESSIDINDEALTQERVKPFFNDSLDFVKTIRETSGALVYMYGYGEKGVRISTKGRLEYSSEKGNATSTNVLEALDTSIKFLLKHEKLPEKLYLQEVRHQKDKSYFFGFGYKIDEIPVTFNSSNMKYPIEIEIYGNKVKSYKSFIRNTMNLPKVDSKNPILLPSQIIEEHIDLIKSYYLADNIKVELDEENVLAHIERSIDDVEVLYYDTLEDEKRQLLLPVWKIQIDKRVYYFDSYNVELLYSHLMD